MTFITHTHRCLMAKNTDHYKQTNKQQWWCANNQKKNLTAFGTEPGKEEEESENVSTFRNKSKLDQILFCFVLFVWKQKQTRKIKNFNLFTLGKLFFLSVWRRNFLKKNTKKKHLTSWNFQKYWRFFDVFPMFLFLVP